MLSGTRPGSRKGKQSRVRRRGLNSKTVSIQTRRELVADDCLRWSLPRRNSVREQRAHPRCRVQVKILSKVRQSYSRTEKQSWCVQRSACSNYDLRTDSDFMLVSVCACRYRVDALHSTILYHQAIRSASRYYARTRCLRVGEIRHGRRLLPSVPASIDTVSALSCVAPGGIPLDR